MLCLSEVVEVYFPQLLPWQPGRGQLIFVAGTKLHRGWLVDATGKRLKYSTSFIFT